MKGKEAHAKFPPKKIGKGEVHSDYAGFCPLVVSSALFDFIRSKQTLDTSEKLLLGGKNFC